MKGLENAIRNLNSLDTRMCATGERMGDNCVAEKPVLGCHPAGCRNTVAGDNQGERHPQTGTSVWCLKPVRQDDGQLSR